MVYTAWNNLLVTVHCRAFMNEPMDMYAIKLAHKTFTEQRHRQLIFVLIQAGVDQQPLQKYSSKSQPWDSTYGYTSV